MSDDVTWLPFVINRRVLTPNQRLVLQVAEDPTQGLITPGRCGKIENLGPGLLSYSISDDGERWSGTRTLLVNGFDVYVIEERVKIYSLTVEADAIGTVFSVIISAKAEGGG